MRFIRHLAPAVFAGFMIGFGGAVALSVQNTVVASLLGSVVLLAILGFDMELFTETAEKLLGSKRRLNRNLCMMFWTLFGNTIGAALFGFLYSFITTEPVSASAKLVDVKTIFAMVIRSVLGGMLLYVAVHGYRRLSGGFAGSIVAIGLYVPVQLCGFTFSVLEVFRYAAAQVVHWRAAVYIVILVLGNLLGVLLSAWAHSLRNLGK